MPIYSYVFLIYHKSNYIRINMLMSESKPRKLKNWQAAPLMIKGTGLLSGAVPLMIKGTGHLVLPNSFFLLKSLPNTPFVHTLPFSYCCERDSTPKTTKILHQITNPGLFRKGQTLTKHITSSFVSIPTYISSNFIQFCV